MVSLISLGSAPEIRNQREARTSLGLPCRRRATVRVRIHKDMGDADARDLSLERRNADIARPRREHLRLVPGKAVHAHWRQHEQETAE
jgi:predicted nucleic acid-binding Zn ribbon protein